MAQAWRLTKTAAAHELNGEESRENGGRWHSPDRAVVYCSSSLALASMECWVHMDHHVRRTIPEMSAVLLAYPDEAPALTVRREDLPEDLNGPEAEDLCRRIGDDWLARGEALALIAPSSVVPHEVNVMLNPEHPAMRDVRIVSVEDFRYDPRMAHPDGD